MTEESKGGVPEQECRAELVEKMSRLYRSEPSRGKALL